MTAPSFQYLVFHPVTRARLGQLTVREPQWTEVVNGGTTFTGKVTVPDNPLLIANIRQCTQPYQAAVYATPGAGRISFGGPVINRTWDDETNTLTITAIDWRTWFYRVIVGPKADGTSANTATFPNVEQITIARVILARITAEGAAGGVPPIEGGTTLSTVARSYLLTGLDFKTLGAYFDELGNMANGFEWDVEPYFGSDNKPTLRTQFYLPQRGGTVAGLLFSKTMRGGNILNVESFEEDASTVVRRVWAVGEGPNAESTPWAADSDPGLVYGYALRTDQATQYSGALSRAQLAGYARSERAYRADTLGGLSFTVRLDNPDWTMYGKGDRARILVQDRWMNIDARNCRILSRLITPDTNTAKLTVNLNDLVLPETDAGGSV